MNTNSAILDIDPGKWRIKSTGLDVRRFIEGVCGSLGQKPLIAYAPAQVQRHSAPVTDRY